MTTHAPQTPAYPLPDGQKTSTAVQAALEAAHEAQDRLGQVMAVVGAAAVRDILTNCDHAAGFDAAHAELTEGVDGSLYATGRYWTADGTERLFTTTPGVKDAENGIYDMNEWMPYLDHTNMGVWFPLVEELPDRDGRPAYRLDLAKAAALPLD